VNCMHCYCSGGPVCGSCSEVHERWWGLVLPKPSVFRKTEIDRLKREWPGLSSAYDQVLAWTPKSKKGLVLHGETGHGKTRCTWVMLRKVYDSGYRLNAFTGTGFANDCSEAFFAGHGAEWSRKISKCDILFIDDIDKASFTDRVSSEMFNVIDSLTSNGGKLIVTTQVKGQEFVDRFKNQSTGEPLRRRISEFCTSIPFNL